MNEQGQKLREVLKGFSKGIIAYYKVYAEITDSITAGLLLSQIAYWWFGPAGEKPFYKTNRDFVSELVMGDSEFKTAKKKLVSFGLITVNHKSIQQRTYYTFNETAVLEKISSRAKIAQLGASRAKIAQQVGRKSPNKSGENRPFVDKDNTTTENTINNKKEFSQKGLSKTELQKRGRKLFRQYGVDEKVARSIVYEQHTPIESIEEAIKNGLAKQKYEEGFTLTAGYIVAALNGARGEGKLIGPTKHSQRLKNEIEKNKILKPVLRPRLSDAEFERSKQQNITALAVPKNSTRIMATA